MNKSEDIKAKQGQDAQVSNDSAAVTATDDNATGAKSSRKETLRWWLKLAIQPLLFLAAGALLLGGLGVAQKLGWLSEGVEHGPTQTSGEEGDDTRYICPMMCTPPQTEPGRCPVCAMELVPASASSGDSDHRSIEVDSVARRVANIQTETVKSIPLTRKIAAIGELRYDEGTLKTLAAYVDGRLDRLYADYTGVVVNQGDHLALLYSPQLYSGQAELLLAKKADDQNQNVTLERVLQSRRNLYASARQRLIEFGMTQQQITELEQAGQANSRLTMNAPISGTVIEKLAVEGQYVKEGQPIYKLADLSAVWLMLELFPEDAAFVRYGHKVEAEVQSSPGRKYTGRVAFIDPVVDPKNRTVGVRVVVPNPDGLLRIGDYAKAEIDVPVSSPGDAGEEIYDPELAGKWISPRHPHVVESSPGQCRLCGVDLVPAAEFGFTNTPGTRGESLVVPRSAVLMAGENSVVYVETEPGRFEIRRVVLGPTLDDQIAILSGVKEGEHVATRGNFLIDSQMQLAGNPSLIDPTKGPANLPENLHAEESQSDLPQMALPTMALPTMEPPQMDLPQMGTPQMVASQSGDQEARQIAEAIAKLSPADRALVERQKICPVTDMPLGSMGMPIKVDVDGQPVFICCEGCRESLLAEPAKYLAKLSKEVTK